MKALGGSATLPGSFCHMGVSESRGTLLLGGPFEGILFYLGYERGTPILGKMQTVAGFGKPLPLHGSTHKMPTGAWYVVQAAPEGIEGMKKNAASGREVAKCEGQHVMPHASSS